MTDTSVCTECSAEVEDLPAHTAWHRENDAKTSKSAQADIKALERARLRKQREAGLGGRPVD